MPQNIFFRVINIKSILFFVILFIIYLISSFILTGKLWSFGEERAINIISKNFDKEYISDITKFNILKESDNSYPSIIVAANNKDYKRFCENIYKGEATPFMLKGPKIEIFDYLNLGPLNPFKDILISPYSARFSFEPVIFDEKLNMFSWREDDLWLYGVDLVDIDGDSEREIVTTWLTYLCGSRADVYQIIFRLENGEYVFAGSLPSLIYFEDNDFSKTPKELTRKTKIKNLSNGEIYDIYIGTTDDYLKFSDLDGDGSYEFIFAQPLWEPNTCYMSNDVTKAFFTNDVHLRYLILNNCLNFGQSENGMIESSCVAVADGKDYEPEEDYECHLCPHTWKVGVYRYTNGLFIIDNNWNNGLIFITPEKVGLQSAHGWNELGWNLFGFIGFYYIPEWNPLPYLYDYNLLGDDSCQTLALRDMFHLTHWGKGEILKIVENYYTK